MPCQGAYCTYKDSERYEQNQAQPCGPRQPGGVHHTAMDGPSAGKFITTGVRTDAEPTVVTWCRATSRSLSHGSQQQLRVGQRRELIAGVARLQERKSKFRALN